MKKILGYLVVGGLSLGAGFYIGDHKENTLIDNEQVRVEYIKTDKDSYDLLIDSKNGINITSEKEVDPSGWYKDWYLVGESKDKLEKFRKKNNFNEPIIWEK